MKYINDIEKLEVLINILIQIATGKVSQVKFKEVNEEYESIRREFLTKKSYIPLIPEFVKNNDTLNSFWYFIRDKHSTYAERKNYIDQSFKALQNYISGIPTNIYTTIPETKIDLFQIDTIKNESKKIFISHSSKDEEYATALVCLLNNLGIPREMILCTSVPLTAIKIGTHDFLEYLKTNLINSPLFICLFSQNYINSPMCLCEMGAAWITSKEQILILTPETDFSLASKTVLGRSHGLKLDNEFGIVSLVEQLNDKFSISKPYTDINFIVTRYLKEVEDIKKKKLIINKVEDNEEIDQDKNLMKNIRKNIDNEMVSFKGIYDIREIKWGTLDKLFFLKDEYIENKTKYTFYDEEINKIVWNFINSIDIFHTFYATYTFPNGNKQIFLDKMKFREDYDTKLEKYNKLYLDVLNNYEELIKISKEKLRVLKVE